MLYGGRHPVRDALWNAADGTFSYGEAIMKPAWTASTGAISVIAAAPLKSCAAVAIVAVGASRLYEKLKVNSSKRV
jgi:hypothetical protein